LTTFPSIIFWGVKFFYPLELIQATIRPGFSFVQLCDVATLAISTRGISQIWLQDKEESRGKKEKGKKRILLYFSDGWTLLLPNIKISEKQNFWESSNFGAFSLLFFLAQFFWFMSWTGIFLSPIGKIHKKETKMSCQYSFLIFE
jgi:hypothetical protein